jgi:hypothetical protein
MQKITVLLCDDHAVVREGLRSLLDASGDIGVIGEAENGLRIVSEAIRLQPDAIESNRLPPVAERQIMVSLVIVFSLAVPDLVLHGDLSYNAGVYLAADTRRSLTRSRNASWSWPRSSPSLNSFSAS